MVKTQEKIYKEIEVIGFYQSKHIYFDANSLQLFGDSLIELCSNVDKVYETITKYNLPVIDNCQHSFIEGAIQYIYQLSLFKNPSGSNKYSTYELNDIVRELTKLL